jgi:purine-nucleoside phosphorylase
MTVSFAEFTSIAKRVQPRACVVLGSGLGDVASEFQAEASVAYGDVPGLVPPSIQGHKGQMSVGRWGGTPCLVCFGRVHYYEGHPWDRVTRLVHLAADLGVKMLVLTNAAGGIRNDLDPGGLMAISGHLKLLDTNGWKVWATLFTSPPEGEVVRTKSGRVGGNSESVSNPYSSRLLARMAELDPVLPSGIYAALTGPTYETPAEIRMLSHAGADAVGMSTAMEAEAGAARGLEIAGISCITNKGAGLVAGTLSHHEVELTAKLALTRLRALLGGILTSAC